MKIDSRTFRFLNTTIKPSDSFQIGKANGLMILRNPYLETSVSVYLCNNKNVTYAFGYNYENRLIFTKDQGSGIVSLTNKHETNITLHLLYTPI